MDVNLRVVSEMFYSALLGLVIVLLNCHLAIAQFTGGQFQPSGGNAATQSSLPSSSSPSSFSQGSFAQGSTFQNSNYRPRTQNDTTFSGTDTTKINWIDGRNIAQAFQMAAAQNKPLLLHFWNERCQPCMALEQFVFPNPLLAQAINSKFIAVKVNTMQTPELHQKYGVTRWPWDVFLTPTGTKLRDKASPNNPAQYTKHIYAVAKIYDDFSSLAAKSKPSSPGSPTSPPANGWNSSGWNGNSAQPSHGSNVTAANSISANTISANTSLTSQSRTGTSNAMGSGQAMTGSGFQAANPTSNRLNDQGYSSTVKFQANQGPARVQNKFFAEKNAAPGGNAGQTQQPELGMEGFCPVSMLRETKKVVGSQQYGCVHRGKLYFFANQSYRDMFMRSPDRYAPVLAGYDVVLFRETGKLVEGKTEHGGFVGQNEKRVVFLFASEDSKRKFINDKQGRYLEAARTATKNTPANWLR